MIIHEYGHSLQDQAAHFFGESLEGASMGEGFGDYLAAVMSIAHRPAATPTSTPACSSGTRRPTRTTRCGRRTDTALDAAAGRQQRCFDDPHCVGRVWSGALWDLRGVLGTDTEGRSVVDRVVLESHFMLDSDSNLRDGARALVAADKLLYAGAHAAAIEAEMVQRGICKKTGC